MTIVAGDPAYAGLYGNWHLATGICKPDNCTQIIKLINGTTYLAGYILRR